MRGFWRRFRKNRMGLLGLSLVLAFSAAALLAQALAPYDPNDQDLERTLEPSSRDHPFGTDALGRDVLSRVLHGSRLSMTIGLVVVAIGGSAGVVIGLFAGYFGGRVDSFSMRFIDMLMAFPSILLALMVVGILGPGLYNVMIAVGIAVLPRFARIMRASVLATKELEFVTACRSTGASDLRIVFGHILPNCAAPALVQATLLIANAILTASSLSFLGLGPKPPAPEWGVMLSEARILIRTAPHTSIYPGLAIFLVVTGFNLLGDGLRDALDVRIRST